MIEQQLPPAKCLSDLPLISAWCTTEIAGDMCVADPTIEPPSDSMESCTRENNDSPAILDPEPPSSPSNGACNELKISEVFTLEQDTPVEEEQDAPMEEAGVNPEDDEADVSVMIVEDEVEPEETGTDKPDVSEVKDEEQATDKDSNTITFFKDEIKPNEMDVDISEFSEIKEKELLIEEGRNTVMIVEDEFGPEETGIDKPEVSEVKEEEIHAGGSSDVQIITINDDTQETDPNDAVTAAELTITDVKSETEKVSAEVISEIDKEILRSLQGTFKNLKTIISGIKGEGRGRGRGRKIPDSEPSFCSLTSGAKPKPLKDVKTGSGKNSPINVNKESKPSAVKDINTSVRNDGKTRLGRNDKLGVGSGDAKLMGDNSNTADNPKLGEAHKWNVERFENILQDHPVSGAKPAGVKRKRSSAEAKVPVTQQKEDKHEEDHVVWICFVCAKEFSNQEELMKHQDSCEEESPSLDNHVDPTPDLPLAIEQISHLPVTIEYTPPSEIQGVPIIRQISETETVSFTSPLKNPGFPSAETSQPVPAHLTKVGSGIKSLPLGLPRRRKIPKRRFKDIYIPPPRDTYFACLGLGPTPAMDEILKSPHRSVSEDDCAIIDLTCEEASAHLASPMTPRSRSLMSQLSRDGTARRRQLSFSATTPIKPETLPLENLDVVSKKSDSDSESSDSSEEESIKRKSAPFKSALLGIDLTSSLGQRLKKHWQNENKVPVISDVEAFCKNYSLRDIYQEEMDRKKTPVMEKLRHRPPPQVTFKFTKKYLNKWFHKYKFNSQDRREFEKILKTGLERESRRLLKRMKPCKVVMQRLTKKDIKFWTTPRVRKQDFRSLQCFRQLGPNAPRFRPRLQGVRALLNRPLQQRMLMMNQMNRARLSPPILQHNVASSLLKFRPARMPTPQFLVRPHDGANGMRLQVMNIHPSYQNMQPLLRAQLLDPGAHLVDRRVQKRKQAFVNLRNDDNLVICLSSDEEEDDKKGPEPTQCSSAGPSATQMVSLLPTTSQGGNSAKTATATDSASSRVFGGSFVRNQDSSSPVPVCAIPVKEIPDREFTSVRLMNGQMYLQQPAQTSVSPSQGTAASQNVVVEPSSADNDVKDTDVVGSPVPETAVDSPRNSRSQSQSDSEYMDFEVICIESDEED